MITDKLLRVSDEQAVTTTAVSTDKIDLSVARDIGEGENLFMNFAMVAAFVGGTSVNFEVVVSDAADLSSPVVIGSSGAVLTSGLGLGKAVVIRLNPQLGSTGKRYLGARYTVAGTYSAGKVTADIAHSIQDSKAYASGFAVA